MVEKPAGQHLIHKPTGKMDKFPLELVQLLDSVGIDWLFTDQRKKIKQIVRLVINQ